MKGKEVRFSVMRLAVVCFLLLAAVPGHATESPCRYSGYHTREKSLTDTEWGQGTAVIKTVSFSKEREKIAEVTDGTLRELIRNHLRSPEFVAKIPMPPYGDWAGKKWDPSNISEFHLYRLYDTAVGELYAVDFRCYVDEARSHESGIVSIIAVKGKELRQFLAEKWGHWQSGEYSDKRFHGLVGKEIVIREEYVTGVIYVFYRFIDNRIVQVGELHDDETDASRYFNPD